MSIPTPDLANLLLDALEQGHPVTLTVVSNSMHPALRVGDRVRVEPVALSALRVGDVVVMDTGDELLTHRFLGWRNGALFTKGDALSMADTFRQPPRLIGRVVGYERNGLYHDWQTPHAQLGHRMLGQLGRFAVQCWRLLRPTPLRWMACKGVRALGMVCVYAMRL